MDATPHSWIWPRLGQGHSPAHGSVVPWTVTLCPVIRQANFERRWVALDSGAWYSAFWNQRQLRGIPPSSLFCKWKAAKSNLLWIDWRKAGGSSNTLTVRLQEVQLGSCQARFCGWSKSTWSFISHGVCSRGVQTFLWQQQPRSSWFWHWGAAVGGSRRLQGSKGNRSILLSLLESWTLDDKNWGPGALGGH